MVEKAQDVANVDEEVRDRNIRILVRHLQNALRFQRRLLSKKVTVHKTITCLNYQYSSSFISSVYLVTKALYLANVILQLWLMNYFLGTNKHQWYGFGVISDIVKGVQWETSGYFPRSSVCDFEVRQVANIQKYSVQCVLVINIFNEKIFVLLWFWYAILFASVLFTFISWLFLLSFPCFSRWFISQHLELNNFDQFYLNSTKSSTDVRKFVSEYLHRDGIFVLRMVSSHAGIIVGTDLVLALWRTFYGIEQKVTELDCASDDDTLNGVKTVVNRRKKSSLPFLEDRKFTTNLFPVTPEKGDNDSRSSKE